MLLKLFVPQADNVENLKVRQAYGELGGFVGIVCNLLLFAAKLTVGLISGSIAIMADAINNLSDAGSSIVTLIGFRMAAKPADREHPFGHGRIEYVAGLVVAVIIIAVGLDFFQASVERIWEPVVLNVSNWGLLALAVALPIKFWMYLFNRALGRRIQSTVLEATAFDSLSDILTTSVVIASVLIGRYTGFPTDGYAGVLIALFIVFGGIKVVRETINPLLGECPSPELVKALEEKMLENPDIRGVHDLILHNYGPGRYFASAHAEVNANCNPVKIHDSLERTEHQVALTLPVRLTLHCDPFEEKAPEYKHWRLLAVNAATAIDFRLKVYDFRMSHFDGKLHLRFTLLVPRNYAISDQQLREAMTQALLRHDGQLVVVIGIDYAYV